MTDMRDLTFQREYAAARPIRWRRVVTAYPCPTCLASPGAKCTTYSGQPKYEPHADRARLASANGWKDPEG